MQVNKPVSGSPLSRSRRVRAASSERTVLPCCCSVEQLCSPAISLSSSFGTSTTEVSARASCKDCNNNNNNINTLAAWLSKGNHKHNSCKNAIASEALQPNKCLAELERLYFEFQMSESLYEHSLRKFLNDCENESRSKVDIDIDCHKMRLNVAAETPTQLQTATAAAAQTATATAACNVFLNNADRSSIIGNTAVLQVTASNSYQRQHSLTIQVNRNNEKMSIGNHYARISSSHADTTATSIVTTSTQNSGVVENNNNGVIVVNCNNINNSNSTKCSNGIVEINNCVSSTKAFSANVKKKLINNYLTNTNVAATGSLVTNTYINNNYKINYNNNNNNNNNSNNNNINKNNQSNKNNNKSSVNVIRANTSIKVMNVKVAPTKSTRTFTSTECQTDDDLRSNNTNSSQQQQQQFRTRDHRRRERCQHEQQHQPQLQLAPQHTHWLQADSGVNFHHPHPAVLGLSRALLPDILHSHCPPPYSTLSAAGVSPQATVQPLPLPLSSPTPSSLQQVPVPLITPVMSTVLLPGVSPQLNNARFTPLPIMQRNPSERCGKGCCGYCLAGPTLRALFAVIALGGVACALGGASLYATGLSGPPNSHLAAALLMIGVGIVLVTVSGSAWRMTAPSGQSCIGLGETVDLARCRRLPCTRGGGAPHGLLYPDFRHRPPPPSYQTSMQEYRLRLLLLDRDRQNPGACSSSPPPTYRPYSGDQLRTPLTTLRSGLRGGTDCKVTSTVGGSYSLPSSYRSHTATLAALTLNSERVIDSTPSRRMLANEDLPEPMPEQLHDCSTQPSINTLLASAIVQIESTNRTQGHAPSLSTPLTTTSKSKDLVSVVTISQPHSSCCSRGG